MLNKKIKKIDLFKDREYILQKLAESETQKDYTLEESYEINKEKLEKLYKSFEKCKKL